MDPKEARYVDLRGVRGVDDRAVRLLLDYWNRRLLEQRSKDWT